MLRCLIEILVGSHTMKKKQAAKLTIAEAREALRSHKMRGTAARIAVLQRLSSSKTPLSHAEVTADFHEMGFDSSTIFRSLTELAEAGLLHRVDLGDGARRFEFSPPGSSDEGTHPHFLCLDCGKITCLTDMKFSLRNASKQSPQPGEVTEVLLKGHCIECQ